MIWLKRLIPLEIERRALIYRPDNF